MTTKIDRSRLETLKQREETRYLAERPKSVALYERAKGSLFGGVPHSWMNDFMGRLPLFIEEGRGAYVTDADGHRYLDLLGADHGAIFGHSPKAVADAVADRVQRGVMFTLPGEDSIWVGEELARRFGLPYWQIHMTASDSNRTAIKIAREITGRKLVLCFNGSYHGTVDETLVTVVDGKMITDPYGGSSYGIGALPDPELRTRVVEFNDLEALEQALSPRDVACVITEPVLAQMSVYPPDPGFHEGLRELTRRFDTLLIIDETHNIVAGAGGFTRLWNLEPDIFVLGKGIASGIPASVMGLSQEVADQALPLFEKNFVQGIGTTLSGNALAVAALRATLEHVMTESAYDRMISGAERIADGMEKVIRAADLPWRVDCLGCRVVLRFSQAVPRNFAEQRAERRGLQGLAETGMYFHTFYANRGILIPPGFFALISPEVTAEDIEFHDKVFGECVSELVG